MYGITIWRSLHGSSHFDIFHRLSVKGKCQSPFASGFRIGRHTRSRPLSISPRSSGLKYDNEFFEFTRARFLSNEAHELSIRRVQYDVDELARVAAQSVDASECVAISKYPDGLYNKALLLTMNNGKEVVAKVPQPNAGVAHYTIASEVATMEFVRSDPTYDVCRF